MNIDKFIALTFDARFEMDQKFLQFLQSVRTVEPTFNNNVVQEFPPITIETNNHKPIQVKSNTTYLGHGTILKTTSNPDNPPEWPDTCDIMFNLNPRFESFVRPHTENVVIDGFIFDGSAECTPGEPMKHVSTIGLYQCDNVIIRNCIFRNSYGAYMKIHTATNITIENFIFYGGDSCFCGFTNSPKRNITIRNCYFDGLLFGKETLSEPITINTCYDVLVENNTICNKRGTCGIFVSNSDHVVIRNNKVRHFDPYMIACRDCTNVDIYDNTLCGERYGWVGIGLCGVQGRVKHNTIFNTSVIPIMVKDDECLGVPTQNIPNDVVIYDNLIHDYSIGKNWQIPIKIHAPGTIKIIRNTIIGCKATIPSTIAIRAKDLKEDEETSNQVYDITIDENYIDNDYELVSFENNILDREDIKIKLSINRNTGVKRYENLDNNGFHYTTYAIESK